MERRRFLRRLAIGSAAATGILAFLGSLRLAIPTPSTQRSQARLGRAADYPPNTRTFVPSLNLVIVRDTQGIRAVSAVCPHLGCTVRETDRGFQCPCHGSEFDRAGQVLSGPAPAPLRWLETRLSPDGRLLVDLTRSVSPQHFTSLLVTL